MLHPRMVLTVSVLWVASAMGGVQQGSIFERLFPNATGQNGYEDYVRAADLIDDGFADIFLGETPDPTDSPAQREKQAEVAQSLQSMDYLAVQQAAVARYGRALDLIASGNQKPCASPHDPAVPGKYPEFRNFSRLSELETAKAYVQGATGDVSGAVKTLLDTLTFTHRYGTVVGIANVYASLSEQTVFRRFLDVLPSMSLKDAMTVERYVDARLREPIPMADFLVGAKKAKDWTLDPARQDPAALRAEVKEDSDRGYRDRLTQASDQDVLNVLAQVKKMADERFDQMIEDVRRPEDELYAATETWNDVPQVSIGPNSSLEDLAQGLYYRSAPTYRGYVLLELVRRTQLRLLGLHARIAEYRWHNHRLPAKLADAVPEGLAEDPLSGEPFVYEINGDTYRLASKGRPKTGPVELRYDRPASVRPPQP